MLVNNATDTLWFHKALEYCSAIAFPLGRIKYLSPDGEESKSPLQGQVFFYFGGRIYEFITAFSQAGSAFALNDADPEDALNSTHCQKCFWLGKDQFGYTCLSYPKEILQLDSTRGKIPFRLPECIEVGKQKMLTRRRRKRK